MDTIKQVSFAKENGKVSVVWVVFETGRTATLQIREADGKRKIFSKPSDISKEEIVEVKRLAKRDGEWKEYGYEDCKSNQEIIDMVKSGKYEYTYDQEGRITGCQEIKTTEPNLFGSAHEGMG